MIAGVMLLVAASTSFAGKPVYVGQRVAGSVSVEQIDHSSWDLLLRKYVDGNGMVNYRGLRTSAADRGKLQAYLNLLSTANPRAQASKDAQLAFWINAYNAVTVEGILQKYPTTSIRNHTAKVAGYNIWHDLKLYVAGTPYSLDYMEHKILRKLDEPRIHFAIVCASIGCPRLLNQAYMPKTLNEQLELNSKDFFSRQQNFRYNASANLFEMSAIIDWFGSDFGANKAAQLAKISRWLPTDAARRAAATGSVRVQTLDYDWKLNEQKSAARPTSRPAGSSTRGSSSR
jgi:hypothetical protein